MDATRLAVLGAGSVRCSAPVIGALATYFGERPLEIRLFDSDPERLDLFDRLARACFIASNSSHMVAATTDVHEALQDADRVVLQVGANCARKYLRGARRQGLAELDDRSMIEQAVESIVPLVSDEAELVSLLDPEIVLPRLHYSILDWPGQISSSERISMPYQVLRWVNGEEGVYGLLKKNERSPLKAWLDNPMTAQQVASRPGI